MTPRPRTSTPPPPPSPTEVPGEDVSIAERLRWLHVTYKTPPAQHISKLPKPLNKDNPRGNCSECGGFHGLPAIHLDYLGHAELTDILLFVDPQWEWLPFAVDEGGLPRVIANDKGAAMWITLKIWGQVRVGVGTSTPKGPDTYKELIGDALRNAAMRFGIGVDLWSKAEGIDRRLEAGQHVEPDSDHDPNSQPAPADRPAPKSSRGAPRQPEPDVWTYDGLMALGLRTVNEMCGARNLPRTGKLEDYVERLMTWQAQNKTPTQPATDIPGEPPTDEIEPADDEPTDPPSVDDPGDDEPVGGPELAHDPNEPDPEPEAAASDFGDEWNDAPAAAESIASIVADVKKLNGSAHTRAYAAFRRSQNIPTKPETWTNAHVEAVANFLDRLLAPVDQ